jgi:hypothetical protein
LITHTITLTPLRCCTIKVCTTSMTAGPLRWYIQYTSMELMAGPSRRVPPQWRPVHQGGTHLDEPGIIKECTTKKKRTGVTTPFPIKESGWHRTVTVHWTDALWSTLDRYSAWMGPIQTLQGFLAPRGYTTDAAKVYGTWFKTFLVQMLYF